MVSLEKSERCQSSFLEIVDVKKKADETRVSAAVKKPCLSLGRSGS